jgi:beta-phosphoglucomutase-like phosphatase (HAD superfamily)
MLLKALIFDVDGTLAETEEAHRQSFNEAFAAFGLPWIWDKELYRELLQVTGGKERLRYYIDRWGPERSDLALSHFGRIYELSSARYAALVGEGAAQPRPGIRRLISEARQRGVKLAIATTSAPGSVEALLRSMLGEKGPSWFVVIAAGDSVAHKKPAPDIYRLALEKLRCRPQSSIAIEDSENGVKAAVAAGLPVIAAPSSYLGADDLSLADSVLTDLGEPGRPCRLISGLKFEHGYVDIDALNDWLCERQHQGKTRLNAMAASLHIRQSR